MVRVVHRVVELVVDLGKPESGKCFANLRKLCYLIFDRTQQRFRETNEMKADTVPFWLILLGFAKKGLNTEPNISSAFNLTFI